MLLPSWAIVDKYYHNASLYYYELLRFIISQQSRSWKFTGDFLDYYFRLVGIIHSVKLRMKETVLIMLMWCIYWRLTSGLLIASRICFAKTIWHHLPWDLYSAKFYFNFYLFYYIYYVSVSIHLFIILPINYSECPVLFVDWFILFCFSYFINVKFV